MNIKKIFLILSLITAGSTLALDVSPNKREAAFTLAQLAKSPRTIFKAAQETGKADDEAAIASATAAGAGGGSSVPKTKPRKRSDVQAATRKRRKTIAKNMAKKKESYLEATLRKKAESDALKAWQASTKSMNYRLGKNYTPVTPTPVFLERTYLAELAIRGEIPGAIEGSSGIYYPAPAASEDLSADAVEVAPVVTTTEATEEPWDPVTLITKSGAQYTASQVEAALEAFSKNPWPLKPWSEYSYRSGK